MNYSDLLQAVASWANRGDLSPQMATFCQLAEQRIYYGVPGISGLRLQTMLTTVDPFTPGALPAGFLSAHRVAWMNGGRLQPLEYVTTETVAPQEGVAGVDGWYTIRGGNLVVSSDSIAAVQLIYYARPPTPTGASDENVVMRDHSAIYLYGMLREVGLWVRDPGIVTAAESAWREAMESAHAYDSTLKTGGTTLTVRSDQGVRA